MGENVEKVEFQNLELLIGECIYMNDNAQHQYNHYSKSVNL
jgi:hypothetical protein